VLVQTRNIQAALMHHGAGVILHGDDFRAGFREHGGSDAADVAEALHGTRAPSIATPRLAAASRPTTNTPRPVASRRPSEPPSEIGLPVTTPVDRLPSIMA
jgi:hypothetical protein